MNKVTELLRRTG